MSSTKAAMNKGIGKIELQAELPGHDDRAWAVAWNPRLQLLASCSTDKTVRLYGYSFAPYASSSTVDPPRPTVRWTLRGSIPTGHKKTVRHVAWSPSGRTLATASFDSTVGIWERVDDLDEEGRPQTSLREIRDSVAEDGTDGAGVGYGGGFGADMNVDGEGGSGGGAQGGQEAEWDCVGTLEGHESECKAVAFSANGGVLASCSRDKSVWIWEVQPDAEFDCLSVLMEHSQDVKTVTWHPKEEILASASYDDTIKLYIDDPSEDWYAYATLTGHTSTVWSLSFSPCGNYLASGSDDLTIRIWRRLDAQQASERGYGVEGKVAGRKGDKWVEVRRIEKAHSRTIYSVAWGEDARTAEEGGLGRIVSAGGDGRICVFEMTAPSSDSGSLAPSTRLLGTVESAHGVSDVNAVSWCPSRSQLAAYTDPGADGEHEAGEDSPKLDHRMRDVFASAGDDGVIRVWSVRGDEGDETVVA